LLKVFARVKKQRPELVYHIVGDGDESEELHYLAQKLDIADSVVFHGRLSHAELAALSRRMLLFLHGGVNETFGMAPLEAIACGTPVVAHKSGGPQEFVNEDCGRLIESLEEADWAKEIDDYVDILLAGGNSPLQVQECARRFEWRLSLRPAMEVIAGLCSERKQHRAQTPPGENSSARDRY
jgi:glycosyltransferase involved in cell wall biosynthesis